MTIEQWGVPIALTLLAVGIRCSIDHEKASLNGVTQAILITILIGSVTNLYLLDYPDMKDNTRAALVGVSAAVSQELFAWLRAMANNPLELIKRLLSKG